MLLRVAAIVAAVQGTAHATLVLKYTPAHGAAELAVVEAMQSYHFLFGGFSRTYWDFYFGYAMMSAFACFIEALVFWQLSKFAGEHAPVVRSVAAVFILFNVGHAILATRYFFILPAAFDALLVLLLGAAVLVA